MGSALIGYTGFVGSTLLRQTDFDERFNRANIAESVGRRYDLVVCAGAPAAKWLANREPEADLENVQALMRSLDGLDADRFVLVSTVDVYRAPVEVDERTPIVAAMTDPYGRHRYELEEFVRERFPHALIVRLPGLFGKGLKKNFIFDLLNANALDYTHRASVFQWYDMSRLWADVGNCLASGQSLVNFATEPVSVADVARKGFGVEFTNETERPPARYDMRTVHADAFGRTGPYISDAAEVLAAIRAYVDGERA